METYHLNSAQDGFTGEYRQVGYMNMKEEALKMLNLWLWVFLAALEAYIFYFLARNLGKLPADFRIGVSEIAIGVVVLVVTLIVHEWIHGLVLRRYGARPKFRLFHNNAIATIEIPEFGVRRNTLILTAFTPFVVLTCLALLGIWLFQGTNWVALFALVAIINGGAAIGDLWVVAILLRYSSNAWTVDDENGMRILMPMEQI